MLLDISSKLLETGVIEPQFVERTLNNLLDQAVQLGQKLIVAAIVFFIGRWLVGWLKRLFIRFLKRRGIDSTVHNFLSSLIDTVLNIILFLVIVNILGLSMTSFAAILAAAGLAIGMAMKDNLANFAGGVMLLINKPFKVGDRIASQGMDGVVQSIGILYTILLTGDNRNIFIPNGPLSTGNIINYSAQEQRRIDITLSVNIGADMSDIKSSLASIISQNILIIDAPKPFIGVTTLENSAFNITIRVWVETANYSSVNIALNEAIYETFLAKGIYTPSVMTVKMING